MKNFFATFALITLTKKVFQKEAVRFVINFLDLPLHLSNFLLTACSKIGKEPRFNLKSQVKEGAEKLFLLPER